MINPEYDREFVFDINAYLIEWYPTLDMATRRSVCSLALEVLTSYDLEDVVDTVVADYAMQKQNMSKKEEPFEDEEDDN